MNQVNSRIQKEKLVLELISSKPHLYSIFPGIDPYSANFKNQFKIALDEITKGVWDQISTIFSGLTPKNQLANAWSTAITNTDWLLLLYRVGVTCNDSDVRDEAIRLARVFKDSIKQNILSDCILNLESNNVLAPPNLSTCVPLKSGIRLRYALSHHWVKGASALEIFQIGIKQKNATDYLKIRELKIAFQAKNKKQKVLNKLSKTDFLMMDTIHQNFILSDASLTEVLMPDELKNKNLTDTRNKVLHEINNIKQQLSQIFIFLSQRKFTEASKLLKVQQNTDYSRILFREKFSDLSSLLKNENITIGNWKPLTKDAINIWIELNGENNLPIWWCLESKDIAEHISNKKFKIKIIPQNDLEIISSSWDEACYEKFGFAGLYELIPVSSLFWNNLSLKDLFEMLQAHPQFKAIVKNRFKQQETIKEFSEIIKSPYGIIFIQLIEKLFYSIEFRDIVATSIGTIEWYSYPSKIKNNYSHYNSILEMRENGYEPIAPEGFYKAIASILLNTHNERLNNWQARKTGVADSKVPEYLSKDPQAIKHFYHLIPGDELKQILGFPGYTLKTLDIFKKHLPEEFQNTIWQNKLSKPKTYSSLQKILLQRITKTGTVPWSKKWLELKGTPQEKSTALVLATIRNTAKLKKLYEILGPKQFLLGLNGAIKVLPTTARRDIGYLELIKALGNEEIPYISAVMSMMIADKKPGHKLDAAYYSYLLPKKSGGNRVISSPHRFLKRVQRSILDKLIQPLGAHPCAFGFVEKRSIGGNAQIHVNNPIVTNSDISNCFPSVKWPLVLGILRRDLGKKLSPGAISILLDICTSNGGLPIGAPTSPALLNRVLYKSDQILHAAATSLNCNYSRYADDMTFSGDHGAVKLLGITKRTLSQISLNLDEKKTNIYRKGRRQIVTGLVVNEKVSVPKRIRKRMRAAVHAVEQGKTPTWHGESQSIHSLEGRLAFLNSIDQRLAKPLVDRLRKAKSTKL